MHLHLKLSSQKNVFQCTETAYQNNDNRCCSTWRPVLSATNTIGIGIAWLPASLAELRLLLLLDDAVPSPLSNSRRLAPVPAAGELKRSAALGDAAALLIGTKSVHTLNTRFAIPSIHTHKWQLHHQLYICFMAARWPFCFTTIV